jgi:hypothetical protein
MAKDHGPSVKDEEHYEKLRERGESKEKAARDRQHPSFYGRQARRQVAQLRGVVEEGAAGPRQRPRHRHRGTLEDG